jgi:hypothetical protein
VSAGTYTKLRTGEWGVRIVGKAPIVGQAVKVQKRDGETKEETIGGIVWSGGGVVICSITRAATSGGKVSNGGRYGTARGRRSWRPCGYPGCSQDYCDECDGEGG